MAPPVADVRYFPHRLSLANDTLELIPTDRAMIRVASFLDGRSDFAAGSALTVKLSAFMAAPLETPAPDRFIFHVAFCGSTLLSRLLDLPGHALVLREPNCLVDLAIERAALDRENRGDERFAPTLRMMRALLRRRWDEDEPIVVKPSNWLNNIVPELCEEPDKIRPLFLTMNREAFVRAVFRGGSDRLAFAARAAVHLTSRGRENAELVAAALGRDTDQLGKLAGLAAVTHEVQMRLFSEAARNGKWGADHMLTMADLLADPHAAARKAARALAIDLPETALQEACATWLTRHAKQPGLGFSLAAQEASDALADAEHAACINAALQWADQAIGPG